MQNHYNPDSPKKSITLRLNSDLLIIAQACRIDISALAEEALGHAVRTHLKREWLERNAAAIAAYNARVEREGVFGDGLLGF